MRKTLAAAALALLSPAALAGGGPAETVVLVNAASPDSKRVAEYYVKKRDVPRAQVCEVTCAATLETTMDEFVEHVVDPLRAFLHERGLEERCRFLVLTQGMPILARTPGGPVSTTAALSLLDTPICGRPQTWLPTFRNTYLDGVASSAPDVQGGRFLLATALLSTTADEATALVERSVASDGTAPAGARFVFQDADSNAGVRDATYDAACKELDRRGFATEHDKQGADVLKGKTKVMGFMSGGSYSRLTVDGVNAGKFLPGAIGDLLESYGAVPANFDRDPKNDAQFPVAHLIRAGITGIHGAVAEPHNYAFPDATLFRTYAEGYTLAETFQQKQILVYWMNLTIGDPLCAPYAARPAVRAKAVAEPWKDQGRIEFEAPGAVRVDVYDEGRLVKTVQADRGAATIDALGWKADEKHRLLVEATGAGPAEPRGWTTIEVAASAPRPAASVEAPVDPGVVDLVSPSVVKAGEPFTVVAAVSAAGGGTPKRGQRRIEVRTSAPPVRWGYVDTNEARAEFALKATVAGVYDFRGGVAGRYVGKPVKVLVEPGPLDHATCPASQYPLDQEGDLEVVLMDKWLNRVVDWEGTIALEVPDDAGAVLPPPIRLTKDDRGRGVFRGVLLTHAGLTNLVLRDGRGPTLSVKDECVTVEKAPLRAWLVGGPAPAAQYAAGDPSTSAKDLRRVVGDDVVALAPGGAKAGQSALLVAYVASLGATKARLLGAAPGKLRVFLDGRVVFDGVPKSTDAKGRREPIADLELADGPHRLAIVAETKGAATASFEIDDGAGMFPASLRVRTSE